MTIKERDEALKKLHKRQADILRVLNTEFEPTYQGQLSHFMTGIESDSPKGKRILSAIDNELIPRWKHESATA